MKLPSTLTVLVAALLVFVVSALRASEASPSGQGSTPEGPYHGQPHITGTLKHLTAAQKQAATDANAAIASLDEARHSIATARKNKGTYQNIARALIDQATEYLQKGDVPAAQHKIDEAITAVNRGGEIGAH